MTLRVSRDGDRGRTDAGERHDPHLPCKHTTELLSPATPAREDIDVISLRTLSFGAPAAERDIDQGLLDYFVESEAYERVAARKKTIVLGNRGTGKSAIFQVLARRERERGSAVIELAPENYSYEMLSRVVASESSGAWAKLGAYSVAWKYMILVMIMKGLNEGGPKLKRGGASEVYKYLRDNHAGEADNPIGVLISYIKRLEGFKVGKYEAGTRARELQQLYKLEELEPLLPALRTICERQRVVVLVDELDRGWDASEDARAFVAGLFQACMSINTISPNITVFMSLRQELYDNIPELYEDAQKYRDVIETISWDEGRLLSLIARRIRYSVEALRDKSDSECWETVFDETLDYRQNKSFNYMVDRTLYRPREIIEFCTAAWEISQQSSVPPVNYSTISAAERTYSEERAKDIAAEYRFQYPGLFSVFDVFRGGVFAIEREDLELLVLGLSLGDLRTSTEAESWVMSADPEKLIEVLWEVGFLRAQAVGGVKGQRRSGSQYVGSHQASNLNLRNVNRFQVHPMFRSYLALREPKSR